MPLNLIKSKKKDGLKKATAFMKRDHSLDGAMKTSKLNKNPISPTNEIINLTMESNNAMSNSMIAAGNRNKMPRLGLGGMSNSLFDEDSGIMSEAETSSTGLLPSNPTNKRSAKFKTSLVGSGYGQPQSFPQNSLLSLDDDPGIMSEAETSSTARMKRTNRGRNSIPMGSLTLNRGGSILLTKPATVSLMNRNGPPAYYESQGNTPSSSKGLGSLFEDDPGIMSEAETSSTGIGGRRSRHHHHPGKKNAGSGKNCLPVVRTPSKTLERPLGLVFLIYRGETKRALLPNEITSKDTVKALFVRSFGKSLTMEYMDSPRVKIYIHDSAKDIFYELENLGEIKDRSILKLFEADSSGRGPGGLGPGGLPPITNKDEVQDHGPVGHHQDYIAVEGFMKPGAIPITRSGQDYFPPQLPGNGIIGEMGRSTTLPRNAFSALSITPPSGVGTGGAEVITNKPSNVRTNNSGISAPPGILRPESALGERSKTLGPGFMRGYHGRNNYASSPDTNFGQVEPQQLRSRFSTIPEGRYYSGPGSTEEAKERMMHMEAQLSQLTGMVEKALKNKKAGVGGSKKTVSFEKSVTFSDEQPPSILSSSSKRSSASTPSSTVALVSIHSQLGVLQKSARELRQEVRVLRRLTQLQSMAMKDLVQDTYLKLREACIAFSGAVPIGGFQGGANAAEDLERLRIAQDEETFTKELNALLSSLSQLETRVEEMRSGVITKKNKISLQDVENMALSLSQSSKSVNHFKMAFPALESKVGKEETLKKLLEKLDNAWRRCKKLTGTLVTLKRLASVQEQRFNPGSISIDVTSLSPTPLEMVKYNNASTTSIPNTCSNITSSSNPTAHSSIVDNKDASLDELLDALQSYSKEPSAISSSAASSSKMSSSKLHPPVPAAVKTNAISEEEAADVSSPLKKSNGPSKSNIAKQPPIPPSRNPKGTPPPPPPRTSSALRQSLGRAVSADSGSVSSTTLRSGETSSSSESINSQEGATNIVHLRKANSITGPPVPLKPLDLKSLTNKSRQDALETRHQELLTRQRQLQEQYQRLQLMQENNKNKQQQIASVKTKESEESNKIESVKEQVKAINDKTQQQAKPIPPPLPVRNNSVKVDKKETPSTTKPEDPKKNEEEVKEKSSDSVSSTKIYETDII